MADLEVLDTQINRLAESDESMAQIVNNLRQIGSESDLKALMQFNTSNNILIEMYRCYFLLVNYSRSVPRGPDYVSVADWFIYAYTNLPQDMTSEVGSFFKVLYESAIEREIENIAKAAELTPWIECFKKINENNIEISGLKTSLILKIKYRIRDAIGNFDQLFDSDLINQYIDVLIKAKESGLNPDHTTYSFYDSLFIFLVNKFNICMLDEEQPEADHKKGLAIVNELKKVDFEDDELTERFRVIEKFFENSVEPDNLGEVFQRPADMPVQVFDYSTITSWNVVYPNTENDLFDIHVYRCPKNDGTEIAVKVYSAKRSVEDIKSVSYEIDILEVLSKYAQDYNCFLKYHGSYWYDNRVLIAMDYHEYNLNSIIQKMRIGTMPRFNEDYMAYYVNALLDAFSFMEELKIYHHDIKPQNILYTQQGGLKIIDFSVSLQKKELSTTTLTKEQEQAFKGTRGYLAPELEESLRNGVRSTTYQINKSDVYSLGLTIYQLYTTEEIITLNLKENRQDLEKKILQITIPWLRTLLSKMLEYDYKKRPTFSECIQYVPRGQRLTTLR